MPRNGIAVAKIEGERRKILRLAFCMMWLTMAAGSNSRAPSLEFSR